MRTFDEKTMIGIKDLRAGLRKKFCDQERFFLRDTSGPNSFGDSFELVLQEKKVEDYHDENGIFVVSDWVWNDIRVIAKSTATAFPNARNKMGDLGAYGTTFDIGEIEEAHP